MEPERPSQPLPLSVASVLPRDAGYAVTKIVVTEPKSTVPSKDSGQLPVKMRSARTRPPLRIDRHFYRDADNRLKLIQLATGAYCFLLTLNCYPNVYANYCTGELFTFLQLFQLVCVNGFCFCVTVTLLACNVCGVPDAFYHYNFPILNQFQERLYTAMATSLYSIGTLLAIIDFCRAYFSVLWMAHLANVLITFGTYAFDCWRRWHASWR